MRPDALYLRPNVQVEPLCLRWYAWPHLISPATASRNLTERHFQIMTSYLNSPQLHSQAVKNPKMRGGPFIDYEVHRVEEITELLSFTKAIASDLVILSSAIADLDAILQAEAKGYSLRSLYRKIPQSLSGYVELVYDLNNHPSFRLIEPLLYKKYYKPDTQSLMLSLINKDERPFVLSTPRLDSSNSLHLTMPFSDDKVDWLFRSKWQRRHREEICNFFHITDDQRALLYSMFTDTPPRQYQKYSGNGIRWRYFGHACILIEAPHINILFDPVLSYTYENGISRYTYDDLPDVLDYVIITHNHQDHLLFETLLQLRHKTKIIVVPANNRGALQDPSLKLILQNTGFKEVVELQELESIGFPDGCIVGLPFFGEHADLDIHSKLGYLIRIGCISMLMLADSCNLEPAMYTNLHREIGDVTAIFLGMECDGAPLSWLYGPLLRRPIDRAMDGSRRLSGCDYGEAIDIVQQFNAKEVYVYAMGQEPWLNYIMNIKYSEESRPIVESNSLIRECRARGIHAERLFGEKEICHEHF